jgi:hypothetical protein
MVGAPVTGEFQVKIKTSGGIDPEGLNISEQ